MKRIGMGLVGAGFIGPHHLEAVRRLGFVDVVAIADFNDELAQAEGRGARRAEVVRQLPGAAGRSGHPRGAQRDAQLHAPPGEHGGHRGRQAHRLRQAAGDDVGAGQRAARRRDGQGRRARGDLQLPRQPARAAGAGDDQEGRDRAAALHPRTVPAGLAALRHRLQLAPRARQGRRVVGDGRHRIALVRPGAARLRAADHARAVGSHHGDSGAQEALGRAHRLREGQCRRSVRAGRHQGRGSVLGAGAVRERRQGRVHRRPDLRRPQERPRARSERRRGVAALAPGTAERVVDRPSQPGQRHPAEGSVADGPRGRWPGEAARRPSGSVARRVPQHPARGLRAHRRRQADGRARADDVVVRRRLARQRGHRRRPGQPPQRQRLDRGGVAVRGRRRRRHRAPGGPAAGRTARRLPWRQSCRREHQ